MGRLATSCLSLASRPTNAPDRTLKSVDRAKGVTENPWSHATSRRPQALTDLKLIIVMSQVSHVTLQHDEDPVGHCSRVDGHDRYPQDLNEELLGPRLELEILSGKVLGGDTAKDPDKEGPKCPCGSSSRGMSPASFHGGEDGKCEIALVAVEVAPPRRAPKGGSSPVAPKGGSSPVAA